MNLEGVNITTIFFFGEYAKCYKKENWKKSTKQFLPSLQTVILTCMTVTAPYVTAIQYTDPMKIPPAKNGHIL